MLHHRSLASAGRLAAAAMVAVAFIVPAAVMAWTPPTITPLCAPDTSHYESTVTLETNTWDGSGYKFDWAFGDQMPASGWTTVAGHVADNDLVTPRGEGRLWVRWTADEAKYASAMPNGDLCATTTTTSTGTTSSETTATTTATDTTTESTTTGTSSSETTATTTATDTTTESTTTGTTSSETTANTTTTSTAQGSVLGETSSPSGAVLAETGGPVVTPPSTDAPGSPSRAASGAWGLVLALGALLSLSILVLTPKAKSRRRR